MLYLRFSSIPVVLLFLALYSCIAQEDCEFTPHCLKNCHWHGTCTPELTCDCDDGWEGPACEIPTCNHCSPHSNCLANGDCECHEGYAGENCTELVCLDHTNFCCDKKGHCVCDGEPCEEGVGVDLRIEESSIHPSIIERYFGECHCAVDEGCVEPGYRRILRFATYIFNDSEMDLFIGYPGATTDDFDYHDCHEHAHFLDTAEFSLWDLNHTVEVVEGMKHGFCLVDTYEHASGMPMGNVYHCLQQGLQAGWVDIYGSSLDCQWLDITDVPEGWYLLSIEVNPSHSIVETNYTNNVVLHEVFIPQMEPTSSSDANTNHETGSSFPSSELVASLASSRYLQGMIVWCAALYLLCR